MHITHQTTRSKTTSNSCVWYRIYVFYVCLHGANSCIKYLFLQRKSFFLTEYKIFFEKNTMTSHMLELNVWKRIHNILFELCLWHIWCFFSLSVQSLTLYLLDWTEFHTSLREIAERVNGTYTHIAGGGYMNVFFFSFLPFSFFEVFIWHIHIIIHIVRVFYLNFKFDTNIFV